MSDNTNVTEILEQRGNRYGTFEANSQLTQSLQVLFASYPGWSKMKPYQREGLEMIAHKISRILNGDPNYDDSWVDIAGYAQLVVDALRYEAAANGK
ncbi:hypothetical protein UFOVP230_42 [uncultured Caudovirales phage]|uniref:DUF6378 domain-containing protein n=1 Tax=uncultured Caudovirales phage TaxID=2100421 RepID=A0A6J7XNX0_9CAUD|nr:hypothetical protein UFOVP230_42 [uncultured Caudovirales phage]